MSNTNTSTDIWISGAFAVLIVDFLVYPVDTLKTRIQSPNYTPVYKDPATGRVNRGLLFRGLYQGVGSVVLATIPASGSFFTTYETLKHLGTQQSKYTIPTPLLHTLSSCTAEAVSCAVLTPAEVIKQNAQVIIRDQTPSQTQPHSHSHSHSHQTKKTGVTIPTIRKFLHRPWTLWSGYTALLGRNLPFTGLNWPVFEYLRGRIVDYRSGYKGDEPGGGRGGGERGGKSMLERAIITGLAASISGTVASVVTTPIDVVKTRMMLKAGEGQEQRQSQGQRERAKKEGVWSTGKTIVRDEGVRGLFRGGAIRSVWTAVSFGVYLCIYEAGRQYLGSRREEKSPSG
ncbi:mitochondrial carrier [Aspergillus heteromorphus CBS 117.55]|uniref:Mitochondrial carrier n=1 Tax=Aspergillus heteromorphus CBS 117.55 TaxID=1448321 RepID=A0A317W5P7_9EURO|nr:mitochondrial carrier [Aspergillus heteromorphus CBS 117.55]PWY81904.1 mitochondrial carrier [Aspergillus heteromorphus CBS 117.55]